MEFSPFSVLYDLNNNLPLSKPELKLQSEEAILTWGDGQPCS